MAHFVDSSYIAGIIYFILSSTLNLSQSSYALFLDCRRPIICRQCSHSFMFVYFFYICIVILLSCFSSCSSSFSNFSILVFVGIFSKLVISLWISSSTNFESWRTALISASSWALIYSKFYFYFWRASPAIYVISSTLHSFLIFSSSIYLSFKWL